MRGISIVSSRQDGDTISRRKTVEGDAFRRVPSSSYGGGNPYDEEAAIFEAESNTRVKRQKSEKKASSDGSKEADEKDDPFLVDWDSPDDPQNPLNWTAFRRWSYTAIGGLLTLNAAFSSSAPSGIASQLIQEFGFSTEVATLAISLFVVGFASALQLNRMLA